METVKNVKVYLTDNSTNLTGDATFDPVKEVVSLYRSDFDSGEGENADEVLNKKQS